MTTVIATDRPFPEPYSQMLAVLADKMIPASAEFPSAADAAIFPRTLARLSAIELIVKQALDDLRERTAQAHQRSFTTLDTEQQDRLIDELKSRQPVFIQFLQAHVASSYYQDDRVLRALGLPARPPHPGGHAVAATDWSLLDPVRNRKPFYLDLHGVDHDD